MGITAGQAGVEIGLLDQVRSPAPLLLFARLAERRGNTNWTLRFCGVTPLEPSEGLGFIVMTVDDFKQPESP